MAQVEKPVMKLDTNLIRIGEPVTATVYVDYRVDQGGVQLQWPEIPSVIDERLHVIDAGKVDTIMRNKAGDPYAFRQQRKVIFTSFDSAFVAVPPFKVIQGNDTLESNAGLIEILSVKIDTTQNIKDINEIYSIDFDFTKWFKQYWGWFAGGFVLVAILVALYILYSRKKQEEPAEAPAPKEPEEPADVVALRRLNELKLRKLWQSGQVKQYHSELSDIVREYIETRFHVPAMEQTTSEIMQSMQLQDANPESIGKLQRLLMLSDLVKFAKQQPGIVENESAMEQALAFVEQTRKAPLPPAQKPPSNTGKEGVA